MQSDLHAPPTAVDTSDALSFEAARMRSSIEGRLFHTDVVPVRIGRFVVLEPIGQGGMGTVYRAYDPRLDRRVAVKVLRQGQGATAVRLEREAQALARLAHPNVVTIHEVGDAADGLFVAMELIEGGTLGHWCREFAGPPRQRWKKLLAFALQAADGLAAAHAMGLVHRDLKPANMLVGTDGRVRLADFGLVAVDGTLGEVAPSAAASPSATGVGDPLTATGELVGTLAYMAPEQFEGFADAKSDQFSFCATFFEAFYGVRPYPGRSMDELRASFSRGLQRPGRSAIPDGIFRTLARGLAIDPQRRFPDVVALQRALRAAGSRWKIGGTVVLAAAAAAAATVVLARPQPCTADVAALGPAWDATRRVEVRDAFAASTGPAALATHARLEPKLDRIAERWAQQHADACRAEREFSDDSAIVPIQACLDHARTGFDETTRGFVQGDPPTLLHAIELADLLADSIDCREPAADASTERGRTLLDALQRGRTAAKLTRYEEAVRDFADILATTQEGEFPRLRAAANDELVGLHLHRDEVDEARRNAEQALDDAEESGDPDLVAGAWAMLATALDRADAPMPQVEFTFERARRLERLGRLSPRTIAELDWRAAGFLQRRERYAEAIPIYERAVATFLAESSPQAAHAQLQLGQCMAQAQDLRGALETLERAVHLIEAELGPDHPEAASFRFVLGDVQRVALDLETAQTTMDQAIAVLDAYPDFSPSKRLRAHSGRAGVQLYRGRYAEALVDFDEVLAILPSVGDPDGSIAGRTHLARAKALHRLERFDEALVAIDEAIRVEPEAPDATMYENAIVRAEILALASRQHEAGQWLDRARSIVLRAHAPASVNGLRSAEDIADVLRLLGRPREAVEVLEAALVHVRSGNDAWRVRLELELAKSHRDVGDREEALRHARIASSLVEGGVEVTALVRTAVQALVDELEEPSEP